MRDLMLYVLSTLGAGAGVAYSFAGLVIPEPHSRIDLWVLLTVSVVGYVPLLIREETRR